MLTKYYAAQFIRLELDENLCPRTPTKGTPVYKASEVEAWLRPKLEHCLEYWHGNKNEQAVLNALERVLCDIERLLDDLRREVP